VRHQPLASDLRFWKRSLVLGGMAGLLLGHCAAAPVPEGDLRSRLLRFDRSCSFVFRRAGTGSHLVGIKWIVGPETAFVGARLDDSNALHLTLSLRPRASAALYVEPCYHKHRRCVDVGVRGFGAVWQPGALSARMIRGIPVLIDGVDVWLSRHHPPRLWWVAGANSRYGFDPVCVRPWVCGAPVVFVIRRG